MRSSLEHNSECRYEPEHPVYSYDDYKNYCSTGEGDVNRIQRKFYLYLLTHEREPETTDSLFSLSNTQCECLLFTKSQFCFHILTSRQEVLLPNCLKGKGFKEIYAQLGLYTRWRQAITKVLDDLDFYKPLSVETAVPGYITCPDCSLVLRRKLHHQALPRHKCDQGKKDKYGEETSLKYIPMFKAFEQKEIELDDTCIPLHWWDFHHLIPTIAAIYEQCKRLGLQTTILQLCFQDPLFMDLFGMLEHKDKVQQLGVYSMYLYLKFRLFPHLRACEPEEIEEKIFPVYVMVVSDNTTELPDLLGYNRTEIVDDLCKRLSMGKEVVDLFNKHKDEDDQLLQNRITDGLSSSNPNYILFAQIMNKYRPVYDGIQKYVHFTCEMSPSPSQWFTINCENDKAISAMANIFGVIPSGTFRPPGEIYKLLMLCSNHPYKSWKIKEKTDLTKIIATLNESRYVKEDPLVDV